MAIRADQVLEQLCRQFGRGLAAERKDRWIQVDLAARIFSGFGYPGIKRLAALTGVDERTLNEYARIGLAFPATVRSQFPALLYSHFRESVRAARLHPHEVGDDPTYWAKTAQAQGWSSKEIRRRSRQERSAITAEATLTDSLLFANRQVIAGLKDQGQVRALIARHNAVYGPFTGQIFQVTLVDYVPVEPVTR